MTGCNVELYVAKPSNLDQALKFKFRIEATQDSEVIKHKNHQSQNQI